MAEESEAQLIEKIMMVYAGGIVFVIGALLLIFAPKTLGIRGKGHPVVVMLLGVIISGMGLYKHNVTLSEFQKYLSQSKNS